MGRKQVAFQGERGAFSEEATFVLAGKTITPVPCRSFEELFETVVNGKVGYGVVPIENSLVGSVQINNSYILEHGLQIIAEAHLRIVHCLMAAKSATLQSIRQVYSHPVALEQCRTFFERHSTVEPVAYYDTAGAAKLIAESSRNEIAAIASPLAARQYKLKLLRRSIEDKKFNYTRVLMLSKKARRFTGKAKTSIAFAVQNVPGALFKALAVFALRDIDLTRIESQPSRKKAWEYHFFVDFRGRVDDERVRNALDHLREVSHFVKVLGCYPIDRHKK
jgi:prephenate dehydratase